MIEKTGSYYYIPFFKKKERIEGHQSFLVPDIWWIPQDSPQGHHLPASPWQPSSFTHILFQVLSYYSTHYSVFELSCSKFISYLMEIRAPVKIT